MGLTIGVVSAWLLRAPRHLRPHIIAATGLGETAAPVLTAEGTSCQESLVWAVRLQKQAQELQALPCNLCARLNPHPQMQET